MSIGYNTICPCCIFQWYSLSYMPVLSNDDMGRCFRTASGKVVRNVFRTATPGSPMTHDMSDFVPLSRHRLACVVVLYRLVQPAVLVKLHISPLMPELKHKKENVRHDRNGCQDKHNEAQGIETIGRVRTPCQPKQDDKNV